MTLAPFALAALLLCISTALGVLPIKKLISMREAKRELKHGSAGFLRSMSGWIIVALWLAFTWFCATILGDWHATDDLPGALDRAMLRLQILLEILAALGDDG